MWIVYLLQNGRRSYVGCTTDVHRRLRQHNGEIRGGARSTRSGAPNWTIRLYVEGFANRAEAMRWERIVKSRARGLQNRAWALLGLSHGACPPRKQLPQYPVPPGLRAHVNISDHLRWPD